MACWHDQAPDCHQEVLLQTPRDGGLSLVLYPAGSSSQMLHRSHKHDPHHPLPSFSLSVCVKGTVPPLGGVASSGLLNATPPIYMYVTVIPPLESSVPAGHLSGSKHSPACPLSFVIIIISPLSLGKAAQTFTSSHKIVPPISSDVSTKCFY